MSFTQYPPHHHKQTIKNQSADELWRKHQRGPGPLEEGKREVLGNREQDQAQGEQYVYPGFVGESFRITEDHCGGDQKKDKVMRPRNGRGEEGEDKDDEELD